MDFSYYQTRTRSTDRANPQPWIGLAQNAFGLTEKLGTITGCLKKQIRDGKAYKTFRPDIEASLGDTLWYLSSLCSHLNISLDDIAAQNIAATEARWLRPDERQAALFSGLFDDDYPPAEQLPRAFRARFVEKTDPARSWLPMIEVWVAGERMGDAIDDNTAAADNYRLHDVLHLANAAFLGWSPVVRKLLRRKRYSDKVVDKYEDGARARDTEEALARLIHNEATRHAYFDGVDVIDTAFLIKLQSMVADLEVRVRSLADWQHCILEAYRVFRLLREHHGGYVNVSLIDRSLTFERDAEPQ